MWLHAWLLKNVAEGALSAWLIAWLSVCLSVCMVKGVASAWLRVWLTHLVPAGESDPHPARTRYEDFCRKQAKQEAASNRL